MVLKMEVLEPILNNMCHFVIEQYFKAKNIKSNCSFSLSLSWIEINFFFCRLNRDLLSQFGDLTVNPLHPLSTLFLSIKITCEFHNKNLNPFPGFSMKIYCPFVVLVVDCSTGKSNQNLTMWGSRPSMRRMEISQRVVGGTPSSSSWRRVFFKAAMRPVAFSLALYTLP